MTVSTLNYAAHTGPSMLERVARGLCERYLLGWRHERLALSAPDGTRNVFGQRGRIHELRIHDWRVFVDLALGGDLGFAEAFMEGRWSTDEGRHGAGLTALLTAFVDNREALGDLNLASAVLGRLQARLYHASRRNTRRGARKNIAEHYDLGNDLFERFLDPSMTYSCALWHDPSESLEQAQLNKLDRMIALARIEPHHRVLEIGTGWGSMAIRIARTVGCHVTTVTLSEAQAAFARERVARAGLSELVEIRLMDYRQLAPERPFDRVVSVEMLEAIGHQQLPVFFKKLDGLLAPNGIASLQVITMPEERYDAYLRRPDFIQRHVFPGSTCPSLAAITEAMKRSRLTLESVDNIGPHYARTLAEWRVRFSQQADHIRALGYDERFMRKWRYYLSYCEAGFATRHIGTLQLVFTRQGNSDLPGVPRPAQQEVI